MNPRNRTSLCSCLSCGKPTATRGRTWTRWCSSSTCTPTVPPCCSSSALGCRPRTTARWPIESIPSAPLSTSRRFRTTSSPFSCGPGTRCTFWSTTPSKNSIAVSGRCSWPTSPSWPCFRARRCTTFGAHRWTRAGSCWCWTCSFLSTRSWWWACWPTLPIEFATRWFCGAAHEAANEFYLSFGWLIEWKVARFKPEKLYSLQGRLYWCSFSAENCGEQDFGKHSIPDFFKLRHFIATWSLPGTTMSHI